MYTNVLTNRHNAYHLIITLKCHSLLQLYFTITSNAYHLAIHSLSIVLLSFVFRSLQWVNSCITTYMFSVFGSGHHRHRYKPRKHSPFRQPRYIHITYL